MSTSYPPAQGPSHEDDSSSALDKSISTVKRPGSASASRSPSSAYTPPTRSRRLRSELDTDVSQTLSPPDTLRGQSPSDPLYVNNDSGVSSWLTKTGRSAWYLIGIVIVIAGIIAGTFQITPVFIALFVALVFTSLLNPMVDALSKHISRWLAIILSLLGALAIFSGMLTFVVTSVAGQWNSLARQLTNGIDKILEFLEATPFHISLTADEVYQWLQDQIENAQTYLTANWQKLAGEVLSNASSIAIFFTITALAIFITVFFLHSGSNMWRWFLNMLPTRARAKTNRAAQAGWLSFSGYARGTVIIALIDGAMSWIYLEIVRVPLAPALGVLVMIGAFIPMVGAPAAMVVAMIVALATDGVVKALVVGIGIALIGQLEGHVLQPLIMGKQVSLSPVVVGIGVVSGTLLGGLLGAIIIIPVMGVTWAVFTSLYHPDPPISGPLPGTLPEPERPKPQDLLPKNLQNRSISSKKKRKIKSQS